MANIEELMQHAQNAGGAKTNLAATNTKRVGRKPKDQKALRKNPVTAYLSDEEYEQYLEMLDGRPVATSLRKLIQQSMAHKK